MVLLGFLAVLGCGENKNEGEVSGTVTYQGQPLPYGTVTFFDSSNKFLASSVISNGKYAIKVPVLGPVKITVTTPDNSSGGRGSKGVARSKRGETITVIPIPAKYGNADQSGLTYTVKPGENTYNIDLQ
jgi:hypothetical protein